MAGRIPQAVIDEVRATVDIVQVVQDVVPLRRVGNTYKGLCPFHADKTPSFHVNRERGFFHCFGCGVGGDVFKFVELQEKVGFLDAVRMLAQRFGVAMPASASEADTGAADSARETLLRIHDVAATWFRERLREPAGDRARRALSDRGVSPETVDRLGIGFAPPSRDGLKRRLVQEGFAVQTVVTSGLVVERDDGSVIDRFRNRLMFPICRESGAVVAFGGRALEPDQQPKYLNSPETALYQKGRTLYGLHLTRHAIRRAGRVVLVEGYFDLAQVLQAGLDTVVATCGTALSSAQARLIHRVAGRAVLSFDPDVAGQGAAARSCDLLVAEGIDVRVALLPPGEDPDTFVRRQGGPVYAKLIDEAGSWLDYLVDRAAARHRLDRTEGRQEFLREMLEVATRIPDAIARDQFADRIAHRARVTEEVVRAEIRKAAVGRRMVASAGLPVGGASDLRPAERDLLAALVHDPGGVVKALAELEEADFEGLRSATILRAARAAAAHGVVVPSALLERLNEEEGRLLASLSASPAPAAPADCVRAIRILRFQRERAEVQREIERLQELSIDEHSGRIAGLWQRKKDLSLRLDAL